MLYKVKFFGFFNLSCEYIIILWFGCFKLFEILVLK